MVGLAHHAAPIVPDFGSLFGTGTLDVGKLWKPPGSDQSRHRDTDKYSASEHQSHQSHPLSSSFWAPPPVLVPRSAPNPQTSSTASFTFEDYTLQLASCSDFDSIVYLHTTLHPEGTIPRSFSRAAYLKLQAQAHDCLQHAAYLHLDHVRDIAHFLQHPLNHDLAHHFKAYHRFLVQHSCSADVFEHFCHILRLKISLSSIHTDEACHIIKRLAAISFHGLTSVRRNQLLTDAYTDISAAIFAKLNPAIPDRTHKYCIALLEGLLSLDPDEAAACLTLRVYSVLDRVAPADAVSTMSQCLVVWVRRAVTFHPLTRHPNLDSTALLQLLRGLNHQHADKVLVAATKHFTADDDIPEALHINCALYWLHLMRQLSLGPDLWACLYTNLRQAFAMADLTAHFESIGAAESARVALHHWILPEVLNPDNRTRIKATKRSFLREASHITYTVSHQGSVQPRPLKSAVQSLRSMRIPVPSPATDAPTQTHLESVVDQIKSQFEARTGVYLSTYHDSDTPPLTTPYVDLITILAENKQNCERALNDILNLLVQFYTPQLIYRIAMRLIHQRRFHIPPAIAVRMINYLVDSGNPGYALRLFQACTDVWPSMCPELIFALIDKRPVRTEQLFTILNRPEFSNSLPYTLRDSDSPTNTLSQERVDLIHHIAYALAKSPHFTPREAFRRVRDCMQYLQDRGAPLSSLMSRALVMSGIVRSLQAKQWLSTIRTTWILAYVRKLEGDDVADQLDKMAYRWRCHNTEGQTIEETMARFNRHDDEQAKEFLRRVGHASRRWKRETKQWRPWLAYNKVDYKPGKGQAHVGKTPRKGDPDDNPGDGVIDVLG